MDYSLDNIMKNTVSNLMNVGVISCVISAAGFFGNVGYHYHGRPASVVRYDSLRMSVSLPPLFNDSKSVALYQNQVDEFARMSHDPYFLEQVRAHDERYQKVNNSVSLMFGLGMAVMFVAIAQGLAYEKFKDWRLSRQRVQDIETMEFKP